MANRNSLHLQPGLNTEITPALSAIRRESPRYGLGRYESDPGSLADHEESGTAFGDAGCFRTSCADAVFLMADDCAVAFAAGKGESWAAGFMALSRNGTVTIAVYSGWDEPGSRDPASSA